MSKALLATVFAVLLLADVFFLPYHLWAGFVAAEDVVGALLAAGLTVPMVGLLWLTWFAGRRLFGRRSPIDAGLQR
jgi:hypothetical protein